LSLQADDATALAVIERRRKTQAARRRIPVAVSDLRRWLALLVRVT
jgi:hypothetical protein